jgi:GT2 family glycosyltransferase
MVSYIYTWMLRKMFNLQDPPSVVSVIIPAYNGERTVLRAISSVVEQRYRPLQLIIVDDNSHDSTSSFVEDFMKKNDLQGEFKMVRHKKNLGLSVSLNDGIKTAVGEYILILHQDCEFVGEDWIDKALSFMNNEKVAVVTGYYGVSDIKDESFIKRGFGVLRKQFHSRPDISCEEATFSEGKCDLYRKDLLIKVGGFPAGYRIAGEDLVVSYRLRTLGYSIVKCYDLPVVQRFSGSAESFSGNLGKEFLFGKVMGGVFSEFKLFLFKDVNDSEYSRSRSLHRASQPVFVLALTLLTLFSLFFTWWLAYFVVTLIFLRWLYYVLRVFGELKTHNNFVEHPLLESLIVAIIGLLTDFAYSFGFGYGLITHGLGKNL